MKSYAELMLELPTAKVMRTFGFEDVFLFFRCRFNMMRESTLSDFKFTYFKKTIAGVCLDDDANLKYGDHELGFSFWKNNNPTFTLKYDEENAYHVVDSYGFEKGYIFIEKVQGLKFTNLKRIYTNCFIALCQFLEIRDFVAFEKFLFVGSFKDSQFMVDDLDMRLNTMIDAHSMYLENFEYNKHMKESFGVSNEK